MPTYERAYPENNDDNLVWLGDDLRSGTVLPVCDGGAASISVEGLHTWVLPYVWREITENCKA